VYRRVTINTRLCSERRIRVRTLSGWKNATTTCFSRRLRPTEMVTRRKPSLSQTSTRRCESHGVSHPGVANSEIAPMPITVLYVARTFSSRRISSATTTTTTTTTIIFCTSVSIHVRFFYFAVHACRCDWADCVTSLTICVRVRSRVHTVSERTQPIRRFSDRTRYAPKRTIARLIVLYEPQRPRSHSFSGRC